MLALLKEAASPQSPADGFDKLDQSAASASEGSFKNIDSHWPEWMTLALYATVVACAISYHEPWADEAQAWQIARSLSLVDLFLKYVRYEGSPGLWHFLLWILNRMHVSYSGMHWVSGAIAVAGVSILVLKSPFPRYLKLFLPFTYFLLFQYAVVARNYVLVPLMLFAIASRWKKGPIGVALLLGLLANVALHATVISGGLAVVYAIERIVDGNFKESAQRHKLIHSGGILIAFYAFALWTAWPPHDLGFSPSRGLPRPFTEYAVVSLVLGMCQPWILSILFWLAIGLCFRARRRLFYLLPVLLFACFSGTVYASFWHAGLLVPLVICLLWITWPAPGCAVSRYEVIGRAALILMAGTQILWSTYALAYDHSHAYSPDLAAAKFLKPFVREGATIAVSYLNYSQSQGNHAYDAGGILPYFDHNIYMNQRDSFWWWSSNNRTEDFFFTALRTQPRIVLVEMRQSHSGQPIDQNDPKVQILTEAGYRLTNIFCGAKPARFQMGDNSCHLIFQHHPGFLAR